MRKKICRCQVAVMHTFNPSTQESGGRGKWIFVSSRTACSAELLLGEPGLHREILSQKTGISLNLHPPVQPLEV